jgi:hypothetical protein
MAGKRLIASVLATAALSALVFAAAAVGAPRGNSASAKLCRHGGWTTLMDSTGTPFADQGDCVSHGAAGGAIYPLAEITVELCANQPFDGICANATGSGLKPGSAMVTNLYKNDVLLSFISINVPASGTVTTPTGHIEAPCVAGNDYSVTSTGTSADSVSTPVQPGISITSNTVTRTSSCP